MEKQESESVVCKICLKEKSKYTCPRCNILYCSLECYKSQKHLQCSEIFYKDCFMEGLKDFTTSKGDKQKILEMLQRVEEDDPGIGSSDDEDDLEDRLEGLDLDSDSKAIWDKLTEKEKQEFEQLAAEGGLSNLVEVWVPWWNSKILVTEMESNPKERKKQPDIQSNIPDITTLLKTGKPSADLRNNAINVLYAYCLVCRLYNGDHMTFPVETAKEVLNTSKVLSDNTICGSPVEAVQLCFQCLQKRDKEDMTSQQYRISIIEDVICVIKGSSESNPLQYVLAALSELKVMFQEALKDVSKEIKKCKEDQIKSDLKTLKKKIFIGEKKIEFLLSWSQRFGMALSAAVTELQLEFCALSSDLADISTTKIKVEQYLKEKTIKDSKKLIQEL